VPAPSRGKPAPTQSFSRVGAGVPREGAGPDDDEAND